MRHFPADSGSGALNLAARRAVTGPPRRLARNESSAPRTRLRQDRSTGLIHDRVSNTETAIGEALNGSRRHEPRHVNRHLSLSVRSAGTASPTRPVGPSSTFTKRSSRPRWSRFHRRLRPRICGGPRPSARGGVQPFRVRPTPRAVRVNSPIELRSRWKYSITIPDCVTDQSSERCGNFGPAHGGIPVARDLATGRCRGSLEWGSIRPVVLRLTMRVRRGAGAT
jgi:hypothetical protein